MIPDTSSYSFKVVLDWENSKNLVEVGTTLFEGIHPHPRPHRITTNNSQGNEQLTVRKITKHTRNKDS